MIQAIQTSYKGYNFRSRLEARWAVFFDALGCEWLYEPEGYHLSDGTMYLPDFFVRMNPLHHMRQKHPGAGYWVEIKATEPTGNECYKTASLCRESGHHGFLYYGLPGENYPWRFQLPYCNYVTQEFDKEFPHNTAEFALATSQICCECSDSYSNGGGAEDKGYAAMSAARSARFEHGQSGAMVAA